MGIIRYSFINDIPNSFGDDFVPSAYAERLFAGGRGVSRIKRSVLQYIINQV